MYNTVLKVPVSVSIGPGHTVNVCTLFSMHQFLQGWPASRRTPIYETALRACVAAREGRLTAEQARQAFVEFAKSHKVLFHPATNSNILNYPSTRSPL